ncbi:MAG: ABC transporter permease [Kineosporiaceae bacterium]|nr:ABC transporter permease [Kineosporiaceae bacterium]
MIRFLLGRLGRLVAILVLASMLVFAAVYLAPGSPISVLSGGRSLTPEQVQRLTEQYHLDDPLWTRYWDWLSAVLSGDLGQSLVSREPVSTLVADRAGTTVLLVLYATVLIVVIGLTAGAIAALRGGLTDTAIVMGTGAIAAVPSFVAATGLVSVFALRLAWFPVFGDGAGSGMAGRLWHLTLPAVALALSAMGVSARVTRTSVLHEQDNEFVHIARIRGLPNARILRRHVFRNALIPVTTALGITVAGLIAGSVVVEQAFSLSGLGTLLVQSVQVDDFAVIQAVTLILVTAFVIVNTVADLVHPLLDPRLQKGRSA